MGGAGVVERDFALNSPGPLYSPWLVEFARLSLFVPSTVRIVDAPQAAVVPVSAHGQVDLSDALVGRHVQSFVLKSKCETFY